MRPPFKMSHFTQCTIPYYSLLQDLLVDTKLPPFPLAAQELDDFHLQKLFQPFLSHRFSFKTGLLVKHMILTQRLRISSCAREKHVHMSSGSPGSITQFYNMYVKSGCHCELVSHSDICFPNEIEMCFCKESILCFPFSYTL